MDMKKALATLAIVATLALTGCASGNPDAGVGESTRLRDQHIKLRDGRTVTCVMYADGSLGGLSCDWEAAR